MQARWALRSRTRIWPVGILSAPKQGGGTVAEVVIHESLDRVDPHEQQRLNAVSYARELRASSMIPFAAITL
jgi:hypothetical protein